MIKMIQQALLITLTLLITSLNTLASPTDDATNVQAKIIGGINFSENYPWMTALSLTNNSQLPDCGASLIHANWVLTAAHCVVDEQRQALPADQLSVVINETTLSTGEPEEEFRSIAQIIIHEDFDPVTYDNDIALLKLTESSTVTPITLANSNLPSIKIGNLLRTMGWGDTNPNSQQESYPDTLQEVDLALVRQTECIAAYANTEAPITSSKLCAGFSQQEKDSCSGDSGGPLVFKQDNTWYQVGIVSYGDGCATLGSYGVYTRITSFRTWIESYIESTPEQPEPEFNIFTLIINFIQFLLSLIFPTNT